MLATQRLPIGGGWIHALRRAPASPRGQLLLVPPFFHEWQRSYRLFALLCEALGEHGIATLRFDYRGSGDASGEDLDFLPSRALADAETALAALRRADHGPCVVLGVRAGHLVGSLLAERHGLPCWAWQPIEDGRAYLNALRSRDTRERNNRLRYPFLTTQVAEEHTSLMGHRLHPECALELSVMRATRPPDLCLHAEGEAPACGASLALPSSLSGWIEQIGISGPSPLAAVRQLAATVAARLIA